MKLTITIARAGSTAGRIITTSHHGKPDIHWSVPSRVWTTSSDKTEMVDSAIYRQINQYLAYLPMEVQDRLYEIYERIYKLYDSSGSGTNYTNKELVDRSQTLVAQLYALIDEEHLVNWVWGVLRPAIPSEIKTTFREDMPGSAERTYLVTDYRALIPLCIIVRLATPVMMQFITLTNDSLHPNQKDNMAFSLLGRSWVIGCAAMRRLRLFAEHTIGQDRYQEAAIHEGISSEDYVDWVLASIVVRKLAVIDCTGSPGTPIIPSALWKFIDVKPESIASGAPKIMFKELPSESSSNDDTNNASILEGSRCRQSMSTGQRRSNPYYLERTTDLLAQGIVEPMSLPLRVCPNFEVDLYKDALSSASTLMNSEIIDEQVALAAWLFHPYLDARSVGNIRKEETVKLLALAQAVFLLQGKYHLATLVTARFRPQDKDTFFASTALINPPLQRHQEFAKTFPMQREFHRSSMVGGHGPRTNVRVYNYAQSTVFDAVAGFEQYIADRTMNFRTIDRFYPKDVERRFIQIQLAKDLKLQVMDYVEELAHRPTIKIDPMLVWQQITANKSSDGSQNL